MRLIIFNWGIRITRVVVDALCWVFCRVIRHWVRMASDRARLLRITICCSEKLTRTDFGMTKCLREFMMWI